MIHNAAFAAPAQLAPRSVEPVASQSPAVDIAADAVSGSPADEYKSVCEFLRMYATLRFYRLALLLGTTGSIITALTSSAVRTQFARPEMLRLGGFLVSAAFLVMEFRATSQWLLLRSRRNELAHALRYQPLPVSSRWNPMCTSGAGFYLYTAIVMLWLASLLLRWDGGL